MQTGSLFTMRITLLLSVVLCTAIAVSASITCGSETCASDELCPSGGTACKCNTAQYTNIGLTPTANVTCENGKMNILVSKCWLEKNRYNSATVRLQSTSCVAAREVVNDVAQLAFHQPLTVGDCGTTADANGTHVTYKNKLYIFGQTVPIQTRKDVVMDVSCSYPVNINVALNVTLHPIIGSTVINGPTSNGSFIANMMAFTDSEFSIHLSESDTLLVEDTLYISIVVPSLDSNLKLKVLRIYASPDNSSSIQYNLLSNGCPDSGLTAGLLTVNSNGLGNEARFTMKVFQITNSNTVYLSADLQICADNCVPDCNSPSQSRSADSQSGGTVSMFLEASDSDNYFASSGSDFPSSWTLSTLLFSWILMKLM
ncbi:uromodulin-like [Pyxicephalus adspersus]|uniref:uromodulin-like n=1 Tax=Pyxicephalus adspersus TaxID=30357 RepID=UPI003B58B7B9